MPILKGLGPRSFIAKVNVSRKTRRADEEHLKEFRRGKRCSLMTKLFKSVIYESQQSPRNSKTNSLLSFTSSQTFTLPLMIIDDLGMRKLPLTAAEELLEIIMRRYERASTLITSNRPVDDWGKLLGDSAAVTVMLDRLLHHGHVLKCGPPSWRTKTSSPGDSQ
jgi:IstB-like ATP binding protein